MDLSNKVSAVITGGASGLGEATARELASQGVKVTLFDMNAERGEKVAKEIGAREVVGDEKICKVSLVGVGMRSHAGVASKMFGTLAKENINIQMISTSEIKISVVIEEKYLELAVRALHTAFDLDRPAA